MRRQHAERQHVGIRPASIAALPDPRLQPFKNIPHAHGEIVLFGWLVHETPAIPDVVGDAPHLGIPADLGAMRRLGWTGREAEYDRPACLVDGCRDLADLTRLVGMIGNAI